MKKLLTVVLLATTTAIFSNACGDGCKSAGETCGEDNECCSDSCEDNPGTCQER